MRALRILLIVAVVLGGLFVAADRLAVGMAESEAADKIKSSEGLTETPDVSIKGFPFLTQALSRELDEVDVTMNGVTASSAGRSLRISRLTAELRDVKLNDSFSSAVADSATGSAHLGYDDLSQASSEGVAVSYGGRDQAGKSQVKVTAGVSILGRTVKRSVLSTVSVTGDDTIRLHADDIPGAGIPGLENLVRGKIDFDRKIDGLPEGMKLDKVVTTQDGVDVSVVGRQVELAG
ncbi:LmeA family phospholipid-binding protein [Streptomyces sp. bgisy100]|uniref:LmeA family phospholipid-binding protein n=1 Tax=Streptomyces sp. bgisy100 TaxID=3413783 RepID=UPI003D70CA41